MDAPVSVTMFDLNGRQLLERQFASNQPIRIDPDKLDLPIGQYFLGINARGKQIHKQMVLVK